MEAKKFGRFEVLRVLGQGGMGTVYLAKDPLIGRPVALKAISLETAEPRERDEVRARFELEFQAAGKLSHPHIVTIYDAGTEGGVYFIAMEYVQGESLSDWMKRHPRAAPGEVLALADQIAEGLDYAHRKGLVHRDVKPGNILLDADGEVKITDFGLVKMLSTDLTQTGILLGTPSFMAPEQVLGKEQDGRADQFAFGVLLYQMLTGSLPFSGEHPSAILFQVVNAEPESPRQRRPDLPDAVDAVLARALAKTPAERFPSCGELVAALRHALGGADQTASAPGPLPTPIPGPESPPSASAAPEGATLVLRDETPGPTDLELTAALEPNVVARRAQAIQRSGRRQQGMIAAVLLLATATFFGYRWYQQRAGAPLEEPSAEVQTTGPGSAREDTSDPPSQNSSTDAPARPRSGAAADRPANPPAILRHRLRVSSPIEAATLWRDGEDTGLALPAEIELSGPQGTVVKLDLRLAGRSLIDRSFTLGEPLPAVWEAEPPAESFAIHSKPPGARILLDGEDTGLRTPAELEFMPGVAYGLRLELAGHKPAGRRLQLGEMRQGERQGRRLDFPLIPLGWVIVDAPYPVEARVGRSRRRAAARHEIPLEPGSHKVRLVAEEVFFRQTYDVRVESGERLSLRPPAAFGVRIAANPGNCRVSIDGRYVDVTPINDRRLAAGSHELEFEWPALGKKKTLTLQVIQEGQRIFVRPD